jgi:hypothetical protein
VCVTEADRGGDRGELNLIPTRARTWVQEQQKELESSQATRRRTTSKTEQQQSSSSSNSVCRSLWSLAWTGVCR